MKLWWHPESDCYFWDTDPGEGPDGALFSDVTGIDEHERAAWKSGLRRVVCPYCDVEAVLADSAEVYSGRSYGPIWLCMNCRAYVGVHQNDDQCRPLGRLANAELREWKKKAHAAFDPLWRRKIAKENCSKGYARGKGYKWLADKLGIPVEECHIGMFDVDLCRKVVEVCRS